MKSPARGLQGPLCTWPRGPGWFPALTPWSQARFLGHRESATTPPDPGDLSGDPTAPCEISPCPAGPTGWAAWSGQQALSPRLSCHLRTLCRWASPSPPCRLTTGPAPSPPQQKANPQLLVSGEEGEAGAAGGAGGSSHPVSTAACVPAGSGPRASRCGRPRDSRDSWAASGCPQGRSVWPGNGALLPVPCSLCPSVWESPCSPARPRKASSRHPRRLPPTWPSGPPPGTAPAGWGAVEEGALRAQGGCSCLPPGGAAGPCGLRMHRPPGAPASQS